MYFLYDTKVVISNQYNNKNISHLGKENWYLICIFISLLVGTSLKWPISGTIWIPYVVCSLLICGFNFLYFGFNYGFFSKFTHNFLLYRIFWSLTFSMYIILALIHIFHNLEVIFLVFFYILAVIDIFLNIFNKTITNEIGTGFLPKLT